MERVSERVREREKKYGRNFLTQIKITVVTSNNKIKKTWTDPYYATTDMNDKKLVLTVSK